MKISSGGFLFKRDYFVRSAFSLGCQVVPPRNDRSRQQTTINRQHLYAYLHYKTFVRSYVKNSTIFK